MDVVRTGRAHATRRGVGAGVVDQDVEAAEGGFGLGDGLAGGVSIGDVGGQNQCAAGGGLDHAGCRFECLLAPTDKGNGRAIGRQRHCSRSTDSAASAGDERGLTVECSHDVCAFLQSAGVGYWLRPRAETSQTASTTPSRAANAWS